MNSMKSGFLLSSAELVELTGYGGPSAQKRWLRARGWRFEVDRYGKPRVLRLYAEQRLGSQVNWATSSGPDWEKFLGAKR